MSYPSVAEVRAWFGREQVWQSWLDVEAALAEVQGEMGLIPATAAAEICAKADMGKLDSAALAADIERTRAPIVSLTRALAAACADDAGGFVHWGATTQNVMQTGRTLLMRRAHDAFMARFCDVLRRLADLAEADAETVMVARTNYRHALPAASRRFNSGPRGPMACIAPTAPPHCARNTRAAAAWKRSRWRSHSSIQPASLKPTVMAARARASDGAITRRARLSRRNTSCCSACSPRPAGGSRTTCSE